MPDQRPYVIPLEIFYTATPVVIVAALFGFSWAAEDSVTELTDDPANRVEVVGFQWSWQFTYRDEGFTVIGGHGEPPEMVLPVGEAAQLALVSTDVNHSFWVPDFLSKRDLIPGVDNEIDVTPTEEGSYIGRCAEFCGLDHWAMYFDVRVVLARRVPGLAGRAAGQGRGGRRRHRAGHRAQRGGRRPGPRRRHDRGGAVTVVVERPAVAGEPPEPEAARGATGLLAFTTTTDHKRIGIAYMVTAYAFFMIGGALAEVIRTELYSPGQQFVSQGRYNEMFTMHGTIMLFLFIGPFAFGLANYFVPLQIGAKDMAFPRLNAMSYWLYLFGGITLLGGFLTADGAADFGWTGYAPLSDITRSPGVGADLWIMSIVLTGLSGIFTAVNIVATVVTMRAPGMRMFRMPIFTWNMLVTSVLVLIAFPVVSSAGVMLFVDRQLGGHIYDPSMGGSAVLWQHLFWFFGHPEVYILVLPYFGIITEVLPVFSWRPVFGYAGIVFATIAIAVLSIGVWAHHMFTTGAVLLPVLHRLLDAHRRADRREVLQLDRHDVGRAHHLPDADALRLRVPLHVPAGRHHRRDAGRGAHRLRTSTTATSSWPTCTTCSSAGRSSRSTPASTTGSRRSPGGCCRRGGARSISG